MTRKKKRKKGAHIQKSNLQNIERKLCDSRQEEAIFLCELCSFMCDNESDFEKHTHIHNNKETNTDMGTEHDNNEIIQRNFNSTENNYIIIVDNIPKPYLNLVFNQNGEHSAVTHLLTEPFICKVCRTVFLTSNELSDHLQSHNEISTEIGCNIERASQKSLENNKILRETHICEICNKEFRRSFNLSAHLTTHTKDYACYVCCNSFLTQFKLDQHMVQHSEEELLSRKESPMTVQCTNGCDKVFYSKYQLYEHNKHHANLIEFSCDQCAKKFRSIRLLQTHKKRHEESSVCNICGKKYSSEKNLEQHLRLHSGAKPLECSVCKMKFRFESGLKTHQTIHTGQRKYKCGQCNKAFARCAYLKEHMRIHFNERPYKCEFCDSTFTQKNVLKTHMAKKHRQCSICRMHVGDALKLRMHVWQCHFEEANEELVCFEDGQDVITETVGDNLQSIEDLFVKQFV